VSGDAAVDAAAQCHGGKRRLAPAMDNTAGESVAGVQARCNHRWALVQPRLVEQLFIIYTQLTVQKVEKRRKKKTTMVKMKLGQKRRRREDVRKGGLIVGPCHPAPPGQDSRALFPRRIAFRSLPFRGWMFYR